MKTRVTTAIVIALLLATGTAVAASGVSSIIVGGDDGATAKSAAQPIGDMSATAAPAAPLGQGVQGTVDFNIAPYDGHVKGADASGGYAGGGGSASAGGRLPFTGLMAIPLMGVGLVLIGAGLFLRRRRPRVEHGFRSPV